MLKLLKLKVTLPTNPLHVKVSCIKKNSLTPPLIFSLMVMILPTLWLNMLCKSVSIKISIDLYYYLILFHISLLITLLSLPIKITLIRMLLHYYFFSNNLLIFISHLTILYHSNFLFRHNLLKIFLFISHQKNFLYFFYISFILSFCPLILHLAFLLLHSPRDFNFIIFCFFISYQTLLCLIHYSCYKILILSNSLFLHPYFICCVFLITDYTLPFFYISLAPHLLYLIFLLLFLYSIS